MITPKEYAELLDYINDKHSWANMYENMVENDRKIVKYVESSCDTRDGKIWIVKIGFRDIVHTKLPKDHEEPVIFKEKDCTIENIKNWLNNYTNGKDIDNES